MPGLCVSVAFSLAFWLYFAASSAVLFALALAVWLVTLPFDPRGRALHLFSCFWAAHYLYANPLWHPRIERAARVDRSRPFVIVSNHQSLADIAMLYATYLPFKWVSKESVFQVPLLGWNMYLNRYVALRRGDRASVGRMAEACRRWLARGVSVLIFPEGTRSRDGALQPFKVGAFRIARDAGVAVLPIVLDGTADALPKHGVTLRARADCRVRILEPVRVDDAASDEEASDRVRAIIERELASMRAER